MQREVQKPHFAHWLLHRDDPSLRCQALAMESHIGHTLCTHTVLLQTPQASSEQGRALLNSSISKFQSHPCSPGDPSASPPALHKQELVTKRRVAKPCPSISSNSSKYNQPIGN